MALPVQFDLDRLTPVPRVFPAPRHERPGVQALYFENEPYRGKPTRVFAWLGLPDMSFQDQCPGMVLIHGGGGTALDEWVRLWNAKGYAAIAIDCCGCKPESPVPIPGGVVHEKHDHAGPSGWNESFQQMGEAREDQWQYHALTALMRAHSLLAAQTGVNPQQIGVTGISWGGILTSMIMGLDSRYAMAIPVYGCGYLMDNSVWKDQQFNGVSEADVADWEAHWDPSHYIPHAKMQTLWVNGTNDFAFPMNSFQKSYQSVGGPKNLSVKVEMQHSHHHGWNPQEIYCFAEAVVGRGAPLPKMTKVTLQKRVGKTYLVAGFESRLPIMSATLCYTRATGQWQDRKFNQLEARIIEHRVEVELPVNSTVAFFNITDSRGLIASSEFIEL